MSHVLQLPNEVVLERVVAGERRFGNDVRVDSFHYVNLLAVWYVFGVHLDARRAEVEEQCLAGDAHERLLEGAPLLGEKRSDFGGRLPAISTALSWFALCGQLLVVRIEHEGRCDLGVPSHTLLCTRDEPAVELNEIFTSVPVESAPRNRVGLAPKRASARHCGGVQSAKDRLGSFLGTAPPTSVTDTPDVPPQAPLYWTPSL